MLRQDDKYDHFKVVENGKIMFDKESVFTNILPIQYIIIKI